LLKVIERKNILLASHSDDKKRKIRFKSGIFEKFEIETALNLQGETIYLLSQSNLTKRKLLDLLLNTKVYQKQNIMIM
jgi:K+ transporter